MEAITAITTAAGDYFLNSKFQFLLLSRTTTVSFNLANNSGCKYCTAASAAPMRATAILVAISRGLIILAAWATCETFTSLHDFQVNMQKTFKIFVSTTVYEQWKNSNHTTHMQNILAIYSAS